MATPSPISATRNSTMNDTCVRYVSGNSSRNDVRIDTAATTIGRKARNEANTKASTARAPTAPSSTSVNTPGPLLSEPVASASSPVTPTVDPGGATCVNAVRIGSVASFVLGSWENRQKTMAYAVRSSFVRNTLLPVLASSTTRTWGTCAGTAANVFATAASLPVTVCPAGSVIATRNGWVLPPLWNS